MNSLTNIFRPISIQVMRMWEALSASEPFYPGFTQAFDTIDQISPLTPTCSRNFKWIIKTK